ncbi:hypothetical protein DQ04_26731000, partial [Trypanosoma grayi]|uniref:hypothetical protein n=1 Tax=Trypanosoma grayi TaxID=71804 RepID=UPI0004F4BA2C
SSIKDSVDALEQNAQLAVEYSGVVLESATNASRAAQDAKDYAEKVAANAEGAELDRPKALESAKQAAATAETAFDRSDDANSSLRIALQQSRSVGGAINSFEGLLGSLGASATRAREQANAAKGAAETAL